MIVAQIIRRTQLIERGMPDPFPIIGWHYSHAFDGDVDAAVPMAPELVRGLEEAAETNSQTKALLRLVYVLEKGKGYFSKFVLHFVWLQSWIDNMVFMQV
jgi:hypothetical protein